MWLRNYENLYAANRPKCRGLWIINESNHGVKDCGGAAIRACAKPADSALRQPILGIGTGDIAASCHAAAVNVIEDPVAVIAGAVQPAQGIGALGIGDDATGLIIKREAADIRARLEIIAIVPDDGIAAGQER